MLLAHTKSPFSIPTESILLQFLVGLFCVWYYDEEDDDVFCILLLMMSMEECITANEPKSYFIFINLSFLHAFCFAYSILGFALLASLLPLLMIPSHRLFIVIWLIHWLSVCFVLFSFQKVCVCWDDNQSWVGKMSEKLNSRV